MGHPLRSCPSLKTQNSKTKHLQEQECHGPKEDPLRCQCVFRKSQASSIFVIFWCFFRTCDRPLISLQMIPFNPPHWPSEAGFPKSPVGHDQSPTKQSTLTAKKLYYPMGDHLLSHIIHPWGNLTNIKHLAKGRSLCWAQLPLHISPTKKRLVDGLAEGPINPYPPENLPQWHQYLYTNKIIMYIYSTVHTIITRFPLLIFTSFQLPCFFFVGISMDAPGLHTNFPL